MIVLFLQMLLAYAIVLNAVATRHHQRNNFSLRADAGRWAAAHAACGDALTDGALEMLCDWAALRAADVVAVSNSTFSFSAALLADAPRAAPPPDVARFWRPHPAQRRLVPFEPWDASPTLNAATFEKGDTAHASPQTTT